MDVDKLAIDLLLKGMTKEQQNAALDSIKESVTQAKAIQKQRIGENVQVVVQALKKLEADIKVRYDETGKAIEKRVASIKDGKDGQNGINGKDGRDGRPGRDGSAGQKGNDGLPGRNGIDGVDGVSVTNAFIDFDGSLIINLSSGQTLNVGEVVAPDLAEKIKVITNGGGTSQQVLDTLISLQNQINNLIPSQTGNEGKVLTTDGTDVSWAAVSGTGTVTSVAATAGTGISVSGSPITTSGTLTITNTAPDQVVSLTGSGTTTISGTYPNFEIASTGGSGTVTSVSGTGTVSGISLSGTVTSSGNLTLGGSLDLSSPPTIGNTAPNTATFTTVNATTFDTNVAAAGVTLSGTTLAADGTDTNIDVIVNPKGTGGLGVGGNTTGVVAGNTITSKFCVKHEGPNQTGGFVHVNNTTAASGAGIFACRSRGTLESPTIVQNNDSLATITFAGNDGVDLALAARISVEVDGTPGSNDMPARMVFLTTPDGSQTPTEALRIDSAQTVKMSKADIDGGTIDGTTVGATTANTGAFTTLSATGVTTVQAGTVSAPAITTSGDTNTGIYFPSADVLSITTGGTQAATFAANGNFAAVGQSSGTVVRATSGFFENSTTVAANYTITTDNNAMSAGPITINSGVTVTVPSGSTWTVV